MQVHSLCSEDLSIRLSEQRTEGIKDMMCSGSYSAFHFAVFVTSGEQKLPLILAPKNCTDRQVWSASRHV